MFGAYLYPYALSRLFASPATDFTDLMPDLESALGLAGKRLESRMLSASDSVERVRIMTDFLERKLDANKRDLTSISSAINTIIKARGIVNIRDLAREHSISARQFERKFKEFAGLSPKLYSRIIRFQATTEYRSARNKTLTEIAYDCGYYDQSHFINDFREFSGYTPKEYFRGEAEGTQYMDA